MAQLIADYYKKYDYYLELLKTNKEIKNNSQEFILKTSTFMMEKNMFLGGTGWKL